MIAIADPASNRERDLHNTTDRTPDRAELGAAVSNNADAPTLDWTDEHDIPNRIIERDDDEACKSHEERILDALTDYDLDLVCLDSYMCVLTSTFLDATPTTLNVHPSLLSAFPGVDAHGWILDTGVKTAGYTIHVVNEKASTGPIVTQGAVPVYTDGDADDLKSRVLYDVGLKTYPYTIRWFAEGRMTVEDDSVTVESDTDAELPERHVTSEDYYDELRCGEDPHQNTMVYVDETYDEISVVGIPRLNEGTKGLSYNNYNDIDGTLGIIRGFDEPAAAVIKHTNPAGCAIADTLAEAHADALATDSMSAFGDIIILSREYDAEMAELIIDSFKGVVVVPGYTDGALNVLIEERNLHVPDVGDLGERTGTCIGKTLVSGRLVQEHNLWMLTLEDLEVVAETEPTDKQLEAMLFARTVLKHVKSNGIPFARGTETIGIGIEQVSRVGAIKLAAMEAEEYTEGKGTRGAAMASDAFLPFLDGVEKAADVDIEAIIQPDGSANDEDAIAVCNKREIVVTSTGQRCFRHN